MSCSSPRRFTSKPFNSANEPSSLKTAYLKTSSLQNQSERLHKLQKVCASNLQERLQNGHQKYDKYIDSLISSDIYPGIEYANVTNSISNICKAILEKKLPLSTVSIPIQAASTRQIIILFKKKLNFFFLSSLHEAKEKCYLFFSFLPSSFAAGSIIAL